ncbi:hypothetical protein BGC_39330 [Burkholderia sp. 3C]
MCMDVSSRNLMDEARLRERFRGAEPILDEVCECLVGYFGENSVIALAPEGVAFSGRIGSRPYIDLCEMNDFSVWCA